MTKADQQTEKFSRSTFTANIASKQSYFLDKLQMMQNVRQVVEKMCQMSLKGCFITCLLELFEDFRRIKHSKNEMLDLFMSSGVTINFFK